MSVTGPDSKQIARQWNREIADDMRREAELNAQPKRWRAVIWSVLWVGWLVLLIAVFAHFQVFR